MCGYDYVANSFWFNIWWITTRPDSFFSPVLLLLLFNVSLPLFFFHQKISTIDKSPNLSYNLWTRSWELLKWWKLIHLSTSWLWNKNPSELYILIVLSCLKNFNNSFSNGFTLHPDSMQAGEFKFIRNILNARLSACNLSHNVHWMLF